MAVGQTSAGGGGEVDIVYGVLADGEGVEVTSDSTIITLPSNIKKLTGLNIIYSYNDEYAVICYPAGGRPNNPSSNEGTYWRIRYMDPGIAGGIGDITVSGNKVTIDTPLSNITYAVAYTYIPE